MKVSAYFWLLMALMLLLHGPVAAINWQGTGQLNNDNLTVIWNHIQVNFLTLYQTKGIRGYCLALSDALNQQWDPAWNVFVIQIQLAFSTYNDAILYGYVFRNHWMWFNGYKQPQILNDMFSFVIWKDYNCQGWINVGYGTGSITNFSFSQKNLISDWITSLVNENILNDPWSLAKLLVDTVEAHPSFSVNNDHAYSIVLSQSASSTYILGRICAFNSNFYNTLSHKFGNVYTGAQNKAYGSFILFQTR